MLKLPLRKSQVWYFDFILAVTLFVIIVIVAFRYVSSDYFVRVRDTNVLLSEANKLSNNLMTPGLPVGWNSTNVVLPGILNEDNSINISKLEEFGNIAENNYYLLKNIMGTGNEFVISFEDSSENVLNLTEKTFYGMPGIGQEELSNMEGDIVTIKRYLVYRHDGIAEIISMRVRVWQ